MIESLTLFWLQSLLGPGWAELPGGQQQAATAAGAAAASARRDRLQ